MSHAPALQEERNYILQMVKKIKASGANVVLVQKSILRDAVTDLSLHYLVGGAEGGGGACPLLPRPLDLLCLHLVHFRFLLRVRMLMWDNVVLFLSTMLTGRSRGPVGCISRC